MHKKKLLSLLVASLVLLGSLNIGFAQNEPFDIDKGSNKIVLHSNLVPESNFSTHSNIDISKMFNVDKEFSKTQVSNMFEDSRIEFEYVTEDKDEDTSYVSMKGTYLTSNKSFDFNADDEVEIITVEDESLINGPITGYMLIDNNKVDLTIHFQKYKHSEDVFITMSLFDAEKDVNTNLSFGEAIITDKFKEEIVANFEEIKDEGETLLQKDISTKSTAQYVHVSSMNNSYTKGIFVTLAKNVHPTSSAFRIRTSSNRSRVKDMLNAIYVAESSVGATIYNSGGTFHVANTEPSQSYVSITLKDTLITLFDAAGVPASVLELILIPYTQAGNIAVDVGMNGGTIDVGTFGLANSLNIDQNGFPFQYAIKTSSGIAQGTFSGSITYRYYDQWDMMYYYTAQSNTRSFDTTIQ